MSALRAGGGTDGRCTGYMEAKPKGGGAGYRRLCGGGASLTRPRHTREVERG